MKLATTALSEVWLPRRGNSQTTDLASRGMETDIALPVTKAYEGVSLWRSPALPTPQNRAPDWQEAMWTQHKVGAGNRSVCGGTGVQDD
jgi:hypothetical protein